MDMMRDENNEGINATAVASAVEEEPLLVASAKCSYSELLAFLETLDFRNLGVSKSAIRSGSNNSSSVHAHVLPPELATQVLQFLIIQRVDPDLVEAVCCSSHDKVHPLSAVLSDEENSWWISGRRSMPMGRGREYIQLQVGPCLRRLTAVSIKIPPLPQGPLSVRQFRIESLETITTSIRVPRETTQMWNTVSQVFTVDNRTGFQRFVLTNPVDVRTVRIMCLSNQIASFIEAGNDMASQFDCVGFFSLRLE
jgi:hypothetical protein